MHKQAATVTVVTAFGLAVLLLVFTGSTAFAQIKLNSNGNIGIGDSSPSNSHSLRAEIKGGYRNYGLFGQAIGASNNSYGLYGRALNASNANIGIVGYGTGGNEAFGAYLYTGSSNTEYAVFAGAADYAGYFSGDVTVTGNFSNPSDAKFKERIQAIGGASGFRTLGSSESIIMPKLLQLSPKSFYYKDDAKYAHMGFLSGKQFGLVAQEVEEVFPELVNEEVQPGPAKLNEDGEIIDLGESMAYKSVNYLQFIPILVQAVKEQQAEIDLLRDEVETLKAIVGQ